MAQLPLPVGRQEFHDGNNWFSLTSENWVLNNIANIPPCLDQQPKPAVCLCIS